MIQRATRLAKGGKGDLLLAVVALASRLGTAGLVLARAVGTAGIVVAADYLSSKQRRHFGASDQRHASLE
jgi:hypothetical protein